MEGCFGIYLSPAMVPFCLHCVLFAILCIIVTARKGDIEIRVGHCHHKLSCLKSGIGCHLSSADDSELLLHLQ